MVKVRASSGAWRVLIEVGGVVHLFPATSWMEATAEAVADGHREHSPSRRFFVELILGSGGLRPRAALGGTFEAGGTLFRAEVGLSGPLTLGAEPDFKSTLSGPMVAGIPLEFGQAILGAVLTGADGSGLPAGTLKIDTGAYDVENSSSASFSHAARLLIWSVMQSADGLAITEDRVLTEIGEWQLRASAGAVNEPDGER